MDKAIFSVGRNNDIHYAVIPENHPLFDRDIVHPSIISICGNIKLYNQPGSSIDVDAEVAGLTIREIEVDGRTLWLNRFRSEDALTSKGPRLLRPLPSRPSSSIGNEEPLFYKNFPDRRYGSRKMTNRSSSHSGANALVKASHLLSDAVYFIGSDVETLAAQYRSWISECTDKLADEQVAPLVRVIIINKERRYGDGDLRSRFSAAGSAGARLDIHVFDSLQPISRLAAEDARCGMERRQRLGQCWTSHTLQALLQASIQAFHSGESSFSFIDAVAGSTVVESVDDGFWEDTFRSYNLAGSSSLLASYIAHHIVREDRYADLISTSSGTAAEGGPSWIDHIIERRYQPWTSRLHSYPQDLHGNEGSIARLCHETKRRMRSYMLGSSPLEGHVAYLNDHRQMLQTNRPKYACAACFFSAWADLLPCGHGFCHRCSHRLIGGWRQSGVLRFDSCPVCLTYFGYTFYASASPPTAGGRVLSLDGGGVKVIVLLRVLDQLEKIICPETGISSFFDLAVGTSAGKWRTHTTLLPCQRDVEGKKGMEYRKGSADGEVTGGLVALALSVKQWSLEECQNKITTIARSIFPETSRLEGALDKYCCGWFTPFRRLLRCAVSGSIYDRHNVERVLQTELGDVKLLESQKSASGPMIRAAVTTENISRGHRVELITTYNKREFRDTDAYGWLQADEAMSDIRTFKA